MLRCVSNICKVNESYWRYIMDSLLDDGLVRGVKKEDGQEDCDLRDEQLQNLQITPKGIEVLSDSKMGDMVDQLIKSVLNTG